MNNSRRLFVAERLPCKFIFEFKRPATNRVGVVGRRWVGKGVIHLWVRLSEIDIFKITCCTIFGHIGESNSNDFVYKPIFVS